MEPSKGSSFFLSKYFHILHLCVSIGLVIAMVHNQLANNARFDKLEYQVNVQRNLNRKVDGSSPIVSSLKGRHSVVKRDAVVTLQQPNSTTQLTGNSTTLENDNSSARRSGEVYQDKEKDALMCLDMLRTFVKNNTRKVITDVDVCDQLRGPKGDRGVPGENGAIGPRGCPGDSFAAPQFSSSPRNLVVTEREPATLFCNATSNPYSHITWYRDNDVRITDGSRYAVKENVTVPSVLHPNNMSCGIKRHPFTQSSLAIKQSRGSDTGTYFCEARNVMGVLRYQINLLIQVYVQFITVPSNITVVEKDSVRLSCRASGVPSPLITWQRKDGGPMPSVFRVVLGDLHITMVTKQDEGIYECVASNVLGSKTTEATITVNVFPAISHFREQMTTINESQSLNLPCKATGYPPPIIRWHKTNASLPGGRYEFNSQRLTVSDVRYEDRGEYVCTANNTLGTVSKRTRVVVQVAPKVLQRPKSVEYGYRGYDKTLGVKILAFPHASFEWKKNGKSVGRMNQNDLTLTNVQYEDSGLYDVIVKNDFGQVRVAMFVIVKDPVIAAKSNCGFADINGDNGRFTSPNYPGQYSNNQNCTWTLTSTPLTARISLSFQTFNTEITGCDYVLVHDGSLSSSPCLGEFYGTSLPPNVTSSSNQLSITFISDDVVKRTGFSAKYQVAAKSSLPTKQLNQLTIPNPNPVCKDRWILVARFSNSDGKNWMATNGAWWYDIITAQGDIASTTVNQDMIAPEFWTAKGREVKITRTDDPTHTALLVTTSNCLGGQTFRAKLTSYGNFRNGAVWASTRCLGSCQVTYGGAYQTTAGFSMASCDGNLQTRNKIGFWCDYERDGAVMMIGGGGSVCDRADHGLGITEENAAQFGLTLGCDFGRIHGAPYSINCEQQSAYALNVWIK